MTHEHYPTDTVVPSSLMGYPAMKVVKSGCIIPSVAWVRSMGFFDNF